MPQKHSGILFPTRRLETLTDGIFAIAMTIIVVTIQIPVGPIHTPDLLVKTTSDIIPKFAVYFLSFLLLAVFWIDHHMFYLVKKTNFTMIWLNVIWLMFIALLPLSTSIIAQFPEYQLAQLIFDFNLLFIGVFLYLIWKYSSQKEMVPQEVKESFPYIKRILLFMPIVISGAILVTFINPRWSMVVLFMIPVLFIAGRKLWYKDTPKSSKLI
jgi:uncharacterized membrane protein